MSLLFENIQSLICFTLFSEMKRNKSTVKKKKKKDGDYSSSEEEEGEKSSGMDTEVFETA